MKRSPSVLLPLALLAVAACHVGTTEEQTLQLSHRPLFYSVVEPLVSGALALQGSRTCLEISAVQNADGWWIDSPFGECYAITRDGAPFEDGSCITLDEPGELRLEYVPQGACPYVEDPAALVPDRLRLQVVGAAGLRGSFEWWVERTAERWVHPGPPGSFPADWIPPADEPLQLVPGVTVAFPIVVLDASGELVAWDLEQGAPHQSSNGMDWDPVSSVPDSPELFPVLVGEGQRRSFVLRVPGAELPVAEVVATPVEAAASLEIVVGYGVIEGMPDAWSGPAGARAIVRDAAGKIILGTPVEWTLVEGHLAMGPLQEEPRTPPEYLALGDSCDPPPSAPEPRRATLRARLGAATDEIELEWTAMPDEDPSEEPFEPDAACQRGTDDLEPRGCGCATPGSDDGRGLVWGVALLALATRRRRARA